MKRYGNIHPRIYDMATLRLADHRARRGKKHQYGVRLFDRNREENLLQLQRMLIDKTYRTSAYTMFEVNDPKPRIVHKLPYFPDRIAQHAAMIPLEPIFVSSFTADTYSCIKKRGPRGRSHGKVHE